jgi:hypothetical protein
MITNPVCNLRRHIKLVGSEIEHCTGVRAVAAQKILEATEITDEYDLMDSCEILIGNEYLFEGYSEPHDYIKQGPIFGKGFPYPSIDAYIALSKFYGNDWLSIVLHAYAVHVGPRKYKKQGEEVARKWLLGAQAYFLEQHFQFETYVSTLNEACFKQAPQASEHNS